MQKVNYVKTVSGAAPSTPIPLVTNSAYVTSLMVVCSVGPQGLKILDTNGHVLIPDTTFNPPVVGADGSWKPNVFIEYDNDQAMMNGGVNAYATSGSGHIDVWITAAKSVDSP